MPFALRLTGHLDLDALQNSLQRVVDRHEVLRTTFRETENGAVQVIASDLAVTLSFLDLTEQDSLQT